MTEELGQFVHSILESPIWEQFRLVPAEAPTSGNIFSLSEYLATLALLLVVMIASDFRYQYRLSLTRIDLRRVGFWTGLGIGIAILTIDVWFQNGFSIPKLIANPSNLKAVLALLFMAFVFWAISVAVIRPPSFKKANAERFFETNYRFIHEGNADRIAVIADELRRSVGAIVALATKIQVASQGQGIGSNPQEAIYAHDFLLLLGDKRFCRTVVDRMPAFALALFEEAQHYPTVRIPIFQFVRNTGQQFIQNTDSALYQERSGYESGLFGYERPTTNILFGSYDFVEKCALEGASPLDMEYSDFYEFDEMQMEGFTRASLALFESYLKTTKGLRHSQALLKDAGVL